MKSANAKLPQMRAIKYRNELKAKAAQTKSIANETAACTGLAGPTKWHKHCGKQPELTRSYNANTR